jgi:hypothetical protein
MANNSFQANQLCSSAGCVLASHSFTAKDPRGSVGPAIGVLLYDKVEVRFEAVRRRFSYQIGSDLNAPGLTQHFLSSTAGHIWEYPLLWTIASVPAPRGRLSEADSVLPRAESTLPFQNQHRQHSWGVAPPQRRQLLPEQRI